MKKIIFCLALFNLTIFSQWVNQIVIPHPPPLNSVYAYNSSYAYVGADSGIILRTTNGGQIWNTFSIFAFGFNPVHSILATSQDTLFCICNASNNGRIFKSVDGGQSWNLNFTRQGAILYDVEFLNSNTGFVYGQPTSLTWFVAKTTNAGLTWDSISTNRPPADNPFDFGFPNALNVLFTGQINIWFGTSTGKIFYSPNGAMNWNWGMTGPGQFVLTVSYIDQQNGYAGGQNPFKTISGNNGWNQQPYQNTGPFYSFVTLAGRVWYSSGPNIFYSTNGGANFIMQHSSPDGSHYRHLSMTFSANDNSMSVLTGWGVTSNGVISMYNETVGIEQIGTIVPDNFKLEQNYPNPFNPVTHIRFRIPDFGLVSIKIYNILGENIATIIDSELKPGVYEAEWDASNYPSGIYYYTLTAGNYSETKKMILIK